MNKSIRALWRRVRPEQGVITIEFSFIFIIFIFFIFLFFEVNRFVYVSASIDLTLSEAARITSRTESSDSNYTEVFASNIRQQSSFWNMFIDASNFTLTVRYCNSVSAAVNGNCNSTDGRNFPLALYSVRYRYRPLLFTFAGNSAVNNLFNSLDNYLSRQLLYVQEYESGNE